MTRRKEKMKMIMCECDINSKTLIFTAYITNSSKEGIEEKIPKHKALKLVDESNKNERFERFVATKDISTTLVDISVLDSSGNETCRMWVRPLDSVHHGMLLLQEQIGVPPVLQRLVCNKCILKGSELWSVYSSTKEYLTVELTVLREVSAAQRFECLSFH